MKSKSAYLISLKELIFWLIIIKLKYKETAGEGGESIP
jgi:hypothetical protein